MAGVIEFLIRVKDGTTSVLDKVTQKTSTTKTFLRDLDKSLIKGGHSITDLEGKISRLKELRNILPANAEAEIRGVNTAVKKLEAEMMRLQTINGSKIKTMFSDAFKGIPAILKNPVVLGAAGIGAAFNEGMKQSKEKFDFKLLLGDDAGSQLYSGIKKLQPVLGESIQQVSKDLLGVGVTSDKILPMLNQMGAVSGGNQEKFNALSGAFVQMQRDGGKLTEGTLAAMNEAGFKPLTQIANTFNMKFEDVQKMLQDGKIDFDLVSKAMEYATGEGGEFAGVMDKINDEPSVKLSKLAGAAQSAGGALGGALLDSASGLLDVMLGLVEWDALDKHVSTADGLEWDMNDQWKHVVEDNKGDDRWKYIAHAKDVLENADEVWSARETDGNTKTTRIFKRYVKYYDGQPVVFAYDIDKPEEWTMYAADADESGRYSKLRENVRKGILIHRK